MFKDKQGRLCPPLGAPLCPANIQGLMKYQTLNKPEFEILFKSAVCPVSQAVHIFSPLCGTNTRRPSDARPLRVVLSVLHVGQVSVGVKGGQMEEETVTVVSPRRLGTAEHSS